MIEVESKSPIPLLSQGLLAQGLLFLDGESLLQWRNVSKGCEGVFASDEHAKRYIQRLILELKASKDELKATAHCAGPFLRPQSPPPEEQQLKTGSTKDQAREDRKKCLNIGHQGAEGHGRGNTLSNFYLAAEMGADMIEFDIVACKDGLIIHHDPLDEQSGRWFQDMTIEQARLCGLEDHPTLSEMLQDETLRATGVDLYFDLKHTNVVRPTMRTVVRAVNEWGWDPKRFILATFNQRYLLEINAFRHAIPELTGMRTACIIDAVPLHLAKDLEQLELHALSVGKGCVTPEFIEDCRRRGIEMWTWTVDNVQVMKGLLEMGVDGLCSNYPDRVTQVISEHSQAAVASNDPGVLTIGEEGSAALGLAYTSLAAARHHLVRSIMEAELLVDLRLRAPRVNNFLADMESGEMHELERQLKEANTLAQEVLQPVVLSNKAALTWVNSLMGSSEGRDLMTGVRSHLNLPLVEQVPMLKFERNFLNAAVFHSGSLASPPAHLSPFTGTLAPPLETEDNSDHLSGVTQQPMLGFRRSISMHTVAIGGS
ncbi:unnamed protein product [Chrysoparadoxa australica]